MRRRSKLLILTFATAILLAGVMFGLATYDCWSFVPARKWFDATVMDGVRSSFNMLVEKPLMCHRQTQLVNDLQRVDKVIVCRPQTWQFRNRGDELKTITNNAEIAELVASVRLCGYFDCMCRMEDMCLEFYSQTNIVHYLYVRHGGAGLTVDRAYSASPGIELQHWLNTFITTNGLNPTNIFWDLKFRSIFEQCAPCESNLVLLAAAVKQFVRENGSATNMSMAGIIPKYIAQEPLCPAAEGKRYYWSNSFGRFACPLEWCVLGHSLKQ